MPHFAPYAWIPQSSDASTAGFHDSFNTAHVAVLEETGRTTESSRKTLYTARLPSQLEAHRSGDLALLHMTQTIVRVHLQANASFL
jgi:hypothetical protein